jgi:hypothetical protein
LTDFPLFHGSDGGLEMKIFESQDILLFAKRIEENGERTFLQTERPQENLRKEKVDLLV